jgi:flagellar biogenesis protein FliO
MTKKGQRFGMNRFFYFLTTLLLFVFPLMGQEPLPEPTSTEFEPGKFYAEFFKMMTMLGIIIVFLLLLMWFVKRFLNAKITQFNKDSPIQVLERRMISQKTALYIVDIHDQKVLIAESHTGSVSLMKLRDIQNSNITV